MKSILTAVSTAALILVGAPAFAQEAPPGASASGCDVSQYTPVISERTGEVLYWTNSSCPAVSDGPAMAAVPPNTGGGHGGGGGGHGGGGGQGGGGGDDDHDHDA